MPDFTFVDQPDSLAATLNATDRIAVDTEFVREKTYFAQLCLVQVGTASDIYCVDPLTAHATDDFWDALMSNTWVVHAGRQDIEVIYQAVAAMPRGIFDTQVAAGLLGMPPQIGYANLASELFDVSLPKSHTRADWSVRPLPDELLHYAAEDVEYLLPACERLSARLESQGRLAWAEEDSADLLDPGLYTTDPEDAIRRLKGASRLRGRKRAAAARLAAWRETEALRKNLPRQWILRDRTLVLLAERAPESVADLAGIDGLSPKAVRRVGKRLVDMIRRAAADENDYRPPRPLDAPQKALLKSAQRLVAGRAGELGITAEIIATRKDLAVAVRGADPDSRLFRGWRRDVVGDDLLELLARG